MSERKKIKRKLYKEEKEERFYQSVKNFSYDKLEKGYLRDDKHLEDCDAWGDGVGIGIVPLPCEHTGMFEAVIDFEILGVENEEKSFAPIRFYLEQGLSGEKLREELRRGIKTIVNEIAAERIF